MGDHAESSTRIVLIIPTVGASGRSLLPADLSDSSAPPTGLPKHSLGSFIAGFKSSATTQINQFRNTPGLHLWQRNFHEHILRNHRDLTATRLYIQNNPLQWKLDKDNPQNTPR